MIAARGWAGLVLLLTAGAPRAALSLDPARDPRLYERQRWGAAEGFPGDGIHGITQGSDGYLWIASERGLLRFDGTEFRSVAPAGEAGRSAPSDVLGIIRDAEGQVWLRPDGPDLLRYRDGRLASVPFATEPREVAVTAMAIGRGGELLLYAQLGGLLARRGERFERLPLAPLPPSLVLSMQQTSEGTLFLGTRDSGLFQVRDGTPLPIVKGLPNRKVNCLLAVGERDLWVGTDRGIVRWTGEALTQDGVPEPLRSVQVLALLRDRDANVWVGTSDGLVRANARGAVALDPAPSQRGAVTALYEDREGDLWVGDGSGLERVNDAPFATYGRAQGLPSDGGGAVYADGDRVWFAPAEGGLYALEGDRVRRIPIGGVEPDRVYSIGGARDGLWLGRQRGGLTHLRFEGERLRARHLGAGGMPRSSVYAVHEGHDGSVWAGTLNAGLTRLQDGRIETFTVANGLPSNSINTLLDGRDGTVWVGTPAGLAARSAGAWTTRRVRDGLPSDNVNALLEDSQGVLWIGTSEGLAFFRSGLVEVPREEPAPLREPVVGLAESEGGWLWIATARRVMRVRRTALLDGTPGPADLVSYGRADGLVGLEGARRHRSVVADPRGRVWFSTNRGLSVVQPRRALAALPPPLVHVRALLADERPVELGDDVRLPPRPRNVRITYTGVSLRAPGRVRFRYSLDGFDPRWSEPVSTETAVYANLSPGSYRFRVQAAGTDGLWTGAPAQVAFTIAPALWQTTWFRLAGVAGLAFAAWLVYAWRLQQATRRLNAAFDERLAERTRIAQELHDTLLQGFVSASMQLHAAAGQVPAGTPTRSLLGSVQELMRQVIEEGRNAVQGLRTEDRDDGDLAKALSRAGADLAGASPAALRVIVKGTPDALHPTVHDALHRIGREALANAFRHARATQVELELEYAPRMVRLLVRDDGAGVDPEVLRVGREGHYGLSGMRERAERIGGRLRLWSAPGAGTEVELVVRGSAAYAAPARGWRWGWRNGGR